MKITIFLVIFLVVAIILEFAYIQTQLRNTQNELHKKSIAVSANADEIANKENKLRIYPVHLDLDMTSDIATRSVSIKDDIKHILNVDSYVLPYTCDQGVVNINVRLIKAGILVLNSDFGSNNFFEDVANNRVNYIIIRNNVFGVTAKHEVLDILHKFYNDHEKEKAIILQNKKCVILLPYRNHEVVDTDLSKVTQDCKFQLIPFIGNMARVNDSSQFLFDPTLEFAYDAPHNNMLSHIIGYKAY